MKDSDIEKFRPYIVRACVKRGLDPMAAEDVAQEVLIKALGDPRFFAHPNPLAWLIKVAENASIDHIRETRKRGEVLTTGSVLDGQIEDTGAPNVLDSAAKLPGPSYDQLPRSLTQEERWWWLDPELTTDDFAWALGKLSFARRAVVLLTYGRVIPIESLSDVLAPKTGPERKVAKVVVSAWTKKSGAKAFSVGGAAKLLGMNVNTVSSHRSRAKQILRSALDSPARTSKGIREKVGVPTTIENDPRFTHGEVIHLPLDTQIADPPPDPAPLGATNPKRHQLRELKRIAYQCGFNFKTCKCGSIDVWRAYSPKTWTFHCYTCGRKDADCWENCEDQLGTEVTRASGKILRMQAIKGQLHKLSKAGSLPAEFDGAILGSALGIDWGQKFLAEYSEGNLEGRAVLFVPTRSGLYRLNAKLPKEPVPQKVTSKRSIRRNEQRAK